MTDRTAPRPSAGLALLGGVLTFSAGDLLRRVVEPATATTTSVTSAVADHTGAWLLAGGLELVAAGLLVAGAVAAVRLVTGRGARLTAVGAWLLAAGAVASTGHTIGYYGTYAQYADSGVDGGTLERLSSANDVLGGVVIAVFMLGLLLGPVLLTIGLRRAALVPVWVPVAAIVFVVAGAVSGVAAGAVGLVAGLASLGYVGVTMWRRPVRDLTGEPAPAPA